MSECVAMNLLMLLLAIVSLDRGFYGPALCQGRQRRTVTDSDEENYDV